MKFIKSVLFSVLLVVMILTAGYYAYEHQLIPQNWVAAANQPAIQQAVSSTQDQVAILQQRAQELGFHTNKILGVAVEKNNEVTVPLPQRTLEYTRYLYCQQVVDQYERKEQK